MTTTAINAAGGFIRPAALSPLRLAAVVVVALLAGCAGTPTVDLDMSAAAQIERQNAHVAALTALREWAVSGRIGVQRDDQGFSGALNWRQSGETYDLVVTGPLSSGSFALRGESDRVTLTMPDGRTFTAASAEELMATHLGWVLPVSGARYWMLGMPAVGSEASQQRRDERGRWSDFAQDGWRVSVLDYFEAQEPHLPRKLFLNRDTLKVRVVIKKWELP